MDRQSKKLIAIKKNEILKDVGEKAKEEIVLLKQALKNFHVLWFYGWIHVFNEHSVV